MNYNNCRGFLSVDYDEFKQSSYKGIELSVRDLETDEEEILKFESGNPIIDFYALEKWYSNNELLRCSHSSSVDHFYSDGNKWIELPLLYTGELTEDAIKNSTIVSFDTYRKENPDDYWMENTIMVCAGTRWIGRSFADLKKYYYKNVNKNPILKTNPLYI